jgi:hypothetical protein
VDRRLARRQGLEDRPHAAPNLFRGGRGEVPYGQVNFLEAVPFEAVRVVGTLVEVDQQPHTAA